MKPVIIDHVSVRYDGFIRQMADELVKETISSALKSEFKVILPQRSAANDSTERVQNLSKKILDSIVDICTNNDFLRLLILFRKTPHEITLAVLNNIRGETMRFPEAAPIYEDSLLFGTNCILKYSNNDANLTTYTYRYNFEPSQQELEDAFKLFVLCVLHRHSMFYLNSLSRRPLVNEPINELTFFALLDVYNKRLDSHKKLRGQRTDRGDENQELNMIIPSLITSIPKQYRIFPFTGNDRTEYNVLLRNFFPWPCNSAQELERFRFLDTEDFLTATGLRFDAWWKIWLALNSLLSRTLLPLWQSQDSDMAQLAAERTDDYGDTALGGGSLDTLSDTCHRFLLRDYGSAAASQEECKTFMDYVTCSKLESEERFTEQPFIFYRIGPNHSFWDFLRHGGLMKAVARSLIARPELTEIKQSAGTAFERLIEGQIKTRIPTASSVRRNIVIKSATGQALWNIDVGFIVGEILFLIEAKHQYKPIRYHLADGVGVADRIQT